ncbi:DUF983 domain-containing protein [Phenylobacterium sp. SCN 70-31]|uniref:DUF983 domain-containing protein n=1 Tax=Phenylobacterium sp. SCN 70-31 TaxID=1660129 RepID=UPI000AA3B9E8|nr:DUF983 domain-containing protein [Phenylobacterium sp. SCN 70-31]
MSVDVQVESPSSLSAGLRCRCPQCGEGKLFAGFLKIAPRCERCGLDFGFAEPADGPAFFVMSGVSIVVVAVWAWWAVVAQPPIWLQFATVLPALVGGCLFTLRPVKAWLVAEQYLHKAEEARWQSLGAHGDGGFTYDRRGVSDRQAAESGLSSTTK